MKLVQNEQDDLPPRWNRAPLGLLASVVGGGTPRRERREFYDSGTIPWATPTDIDQDRILSVKDTNTRISELGLLKSSARLLPAGTVLFSSRASIGKIGIAAQPMATNQGFANLIPSAAVDGLYLAYCLKKFTEEIKGLASGTTYLEVSKSALREFPIPLPPLREQRRIVAKIEALFEQGRTARQALDRIPPLLKKFRQAVLSAAFRGGLTRDWRDQHPDIEPASALLDHIRAERRRKWEGNLGASRGEISRKARYTEPLQADADQLPELPEGWNWATIDAVTDRVTSGSRAWRARCGSGTGTFILAQNVRPGLLDLSNRTWVNAPNDQETFRTRVEVGDILVTIVGNTGDTCVVTKDPEEAYVCQSVALLRPVEASLSRWLGLYLQSYQGGQRQFRQFQYGMGRAHLGLLHLRQTVAPVAPPSERDEILRRIDEWFVRADVVESAVATVHRRAEKLEQSILARAFRGELVPQDPNDGPASVLLDHIRAERGKISIQATRAGIGRRRAVTKGEADV